MDILVIVGANNGNTCLLTNFMVFGILNTISEFIAFFMVLLLALLGTAITAAAGANAGVMALPIPYTLTLLAHAICTIVMTVIVNSLKTLINQGNGVSPENGVVPMQPMGQMQGY